MSPSTMFGFALAVAPLRMTSGTSAGGCEPRKRPRRPVTATRPVTLSPHLLELNRPSSTVPKVDLLPFLFEPPNVSWVDPPSAYAPSPTKPRPPPKRRAPPAAEPDKPKKRAVRKPHGYWNDLRHVEQELELVNAALGRRGKRQMPRLAEIRGLGRGDLIAALAKHGGVKHVAAMLRWGRKTRQSRKLPSSIDSAMRLPYAGVRPKLVRQPRDYWADLSTLQREVRAFVHEFCPPGVMPTQTVLRTRKRHDLLNAIARHGGMSAVATGMGYKCRRAYKRRMVLKEFDSFKADLLKFVEQHCPGRMPTADELMKNGASGLANAVAVHGGYPAVAKRVGLQGRNTAAQGAPHTWDLQRLGVELRELTRMHYPELALANRMPTEQKLRKQGRNDLSYAIKKFGGFARVRVQLAFAEKGKGPLGRRD